MAVGIGVVVGNRDKDADLPIVYVVALAKWSSGDYSGCSVSAERGGIHAHVSSSLGWLELDTTRDIGHLFPDGYRRVLIDRTAGEPMPEDIAHHFTKRDDRSSGE